MSLARPGFSPASPTIGKVSSVSDKSQAKLLPVYAAVGADDYRKDEAVARLRNIVSKSGDLAFNSETFDGHSGYPDAGELRSSLDTMPFGADFRLVVIDGVDRAGKELSEQLVSYLKDPNPTTVLMMTADKLAKNTRLYKAVASYGEKAVIDCTPRKAYELPPVVVGMARRHGLVMDETSARDLVSLVGESRTMIDNQLSKLEMLLGPGAQVDVATLRENVARVAKVQPWDFLDAVGARRPDEAMRQYALLDKGELVGLLARTVRRLRELLAAKCLQERGETSALARELGLQAWQTKKLPGFARNYSFAELRRAISSAAACDASLKSEPDKDLAFQTWVLSFCTPTDGRPRG